jgi:hypothetical protein
MVSMARKLDITFKSKDNSKINELNQILDKMSLEGKLSDREKDFLDHFDTIQDNELQDYNYLSLLDLFYILTKINKIVICDIKDKQGKINDQVMSMEYNHDDCIITLGLKHGTFELTDNFLYRLMYQFKNDNYSLDIESEYYEKINLDR